LFYLFPIQLFETRKQDENKVTTLLLEMKTGNENRSKQALNISGEGVSIKKNLDMHFSSFTIIFAISFTIILKYLPLATGRPTLNLERSLDHDGHPLAITTADAVAASGVPPWNWRETSGNGKLCRAS